MRGLRSLDRSERFLFYTGLVMAASEIWKQWTLTFVLGGGSYNWWYFPFQLCSVPMYLLLLLPVVHASRLRRIFLTFLMDFSLLSGIGAFLDTSGMHYPLPALTCHPDCRGDLLRSFRHQRSYVAWLFLLCHPVCGSL